MPETAGPWTFSPFSTGGDLQRKIKSQKPVDFSCFSLFSDLLFPLFFNSAFSELTVALGCCCGTERRLGREQRGLLPCSV
jgi:hypothetical protein